MIWLYYFLNLTLTNFLLLPALSGLFFHMPLARKLVAKNLINDKSEFIKMQWKRFLIFLSLYLFFIGTSFYFLGAGALMSTAINCVLCIGVEYKKIIGKHSLSVEAFLSSNLKYFKDQSAVTSIVHERISTKT